MREFIAHRLVSNITKLCWQWEDDVVIDPVVLRLSWSWVVDARGTKIFCGMCVKNYFVCLVCIMKKGSIGDF